MSHTSPVSELPLSQQTLYLIDISSFIFRAFFAIRSLHNSAGEPTNAVYGVATMLARLAEQAQPEYLAVVYDSKEPSFRKEIYSEYKANRSAPPEELIPQFARIERLIEAFEIHSYRQSGVEADDLIATLTHKWCHASDQNQVVIVSSDKDLMQLVNDRVTLWDTMSDKRYGASEVEKKFGVRPDQIRDYLALVGDSSDNIPGVPSIGPKSAVDLLKEYGTLEEVLKAAQKGKISGKKGETLKLHESDARLSAQLATVRLDLEVEIPVTSLRYHFHLTQLGVQLFEELDFHSLIEKWRTDLTEKSQSNEWVECRFRSITEEKDFQVLLEQIETRKIFGFDLETTSLNPREAKIVGIAIATELTSAVYIPIGHKNTSQAQLPAKKVLDSLKPFLESTEYLKVGQNLKYDWSVLREYGFNPRGIGADTMVAGYVLESNGRHNLQTLAARYLKYSVQTYEEVCGKGKDQLSFDEIEIDRATRYSAEDAWVAVQLWDKLKPLLEAENLLKVFEKVDLPMVDLLAKMELQGVCIDEEWLKTLSKDFGCQLKSIEEKMGVYADGPLNLNSPKQLALLLFDKLGLPTQGKTKTGFSTDATVLEALSPLHEVPRLLLEYREISKLKGTYVDPLPLLRDSKTGKIHASFHQTVAATGRLSSSDPNLQNIPIRTDRGMKIRRAFIPSPGNILVSADYSQIELRLLAHMSGDPELTRSFQQEEDVHQRTASEIFGIRTQDVTDQQRSIAKAINFGLMYGKTVFGLSQELKIPRKEAQNIIDRYFKKYSAVKVFLDHQIAQAKEVGYVTTLMGRRRRLPDINSKNAAVRANAERMAMNSPIQGTAADLMKLAMIALDEKLENGRYQSKMMIQVHDEVVLDCPKNEVSDVKKMVVHVMETAMSLSVPLRVNVASGENWMQL